MRVGIVGAGGLGGPVALALSRAGAHLTLWDDDSVELSNLQRQVQFRTADIGRKKVEALADALVRRGVCPGQVRAHAERFTGEPGRIADIDLLDIDLLIDASDDFATKFAVSDSALRAGLPYVIGSVLRHGGQVFARAVGSTMGCYRCLFEEPPEDYATCADAGVLGAAVAIIGGVMAKLALALLAGVSAASGLWVFDDLRSPALDLGVREIRYERRRSCPACMPAVPAHAQPGFPGRASASPVGSAHAAQRPSQRQQAPETTKE